MKQVVITKPGDIDVLAVEQASDPQPGPDEVLIDVKAAGINFADIMARKGMYPDAPPMPCVVGYEVSGIVEQVGSNVDAALKGKEVLAMTRFKGYSSKVSVPAIQTFEKPDNLSFEEAAAIPVTYMTAWQLLVAMGGLKQGESLLIQNAGGGVGLAALDIAKHIGAVTYGTASSRKHSFLKERGLDHAIDYTTQDWEKEIDRLTEGKGVDLVIDPLGGNHWKKSYRALRSAGRLGMFGISTASKSGQGKGSKLSMLKAAIGMPFFHPVGLMNVNKGVFGVNMGHMWHEAEKLAGWMAEIMKGVEAGWVRPYVDKVYPFDETGEAHRYIEGRGNIGKVILVP